MPCMRLSSGTKLGWCLTSFQIAAPALRAAHPRRKFATMARAGSRLEGQCIFVTGATDGIGEHTATRLAQEGATVLVHGRSIEKASNTADVIRKRTGNPNVEPYGADLSSMRQVRSLAAAVKERHPTLAVLLNNAGVFASQMQTTEDGYELTWAVNVMAPYLLTGLLLDSVTDRVVNVSSISAASYIDFDNLQQGLRQFG
eukprot:jgi/Botrbrau1/12894/Bobra.0299s0013.2